jgi:hypothetical protein
MKYHSHTHIKGIQSWIKHARYPTKTRDQEVYAFYEEEGHEVMDCPFVPFHINTSIARHVEL